MTFNPHILVLDFHFCDHISHPRLQEHTSPHVWLNDQQAKIFDHDKEQKSNHFVRDDFTSVSIFGSQYWNTDNSQIPALNDILKTSLWPYLAPKCSGVLSSLSNASSCALEPQAQLFPKRKCARIMLCQRCLCFSLDDQYHSTRNTQHPVTSAKQHCHDFGVTLSCNPMKRGHTFFVYSL